MGRLYDRVSVEGVLYAFGFDRIGVVVSDLYFVDPEPGEGQDGAERGVRIEVRMLDRTDLPGSIYSAQPITIGEPVWRGDLLETVAGPAGSHDRTHHHPAFRGWEPGRRHYVPELSSDPLGWLSGRLSDLDALLLEAGLDPGDAAAHDAEDLRAAAPEIVGAVERLLVRVRAGELARPPTDEPALSARIGWL
jgi:hypothetical protein